MLRKTFAVLLAWCAVLTAIPASAADVQAARQFVDDVGQGVLAIINAADVDEGQKQTQLRRLFTEHADIPWMGRFVLGRAWNQATEEQKNNYLEAYKEYLLAQYTTRFSEYTGSNYTIMDAKPEEQGQFTVGMQIKSPNAEQKNIQAGYRLRPGEKGQFKIVDIIVEGVSMITTQRADFASAVQQRGMEGLISDLQTKAQQKQAGSKQDEKRRL